MTAERKDEGDLTVREAGRRGGQKVRDKHGREFYVEIGKLGGRVISQKKRGTGFFVRIGKKGGDSTVAGHDREHFAKIGRMGGEALKAARDPGYYAEIGRKGRQKRREAAKDRREKGA